MIKPDAREAHWDDKATSLLTALILHTLRAPPELRNLAHVRRLSVGGAETTFLANATCRVFFEINDNLTAQYAREMLGFTTTRSLSSGHSRPGAAGAAAQRQRGTTESGHWLLDAAEIQRLPPQRQIAKLRDVAYPLALQRIDCWKSRKWER